MAVEEVGVRADIMRLLGSLARTALDDPSTHLVLLEVMPHSTTHMYRNE